MSEQPLSPKIHFSRILIELGRYIQRINLNRIVDGLEAEKIFSPELAQGLRGLDDEYEKSNVVTGMLHGKGEREFKMFLKMVASENPDGKFHDATKQFFSGFTAFPGYEEYATWPNVKLSICGFTQIGSEVVLIVDREGAISYDPVHGTTICVAAGSLPKGEEQVTVTRRHGYNACKLHPSMQTCSATVYFEVEPKVEFTKDVLFEIPYTFSSSDTHQLCFIRYDHDMDSTGFGEIQSTGMFPPDYPYGVIALRTFSSYKVSTKKKFQHKSLERKSRICKLQPKHLRSQVKLAKSQESQLVKDLSVPSATTAELDPVPNAYWLSVTESTDKRTISFSLSQFTPTGHKVMSQSQEGSVCALSQLTFQSDELLFHPQSAEDLDWKLFAANKYKVKKSEVDSNGHFVVVKYHLVTTKLQSSTSACFPVTITGGDNNITYYITNLSTDARISIIDDEFLRKLFHSPVNKNSFLYKLALKLPHWQPVAKLLNLRESSIAEIEIDYPVGQGEQAYQAILKWMQTKGRDATYGELLVALYNATLSSDHVTDAWWYAYRFFPQI